MSVTSRDVRYQDIRIFRNFESITNISTAITLITNKSKFHFASMFEWRLTDERTKFKSMISENISKRTKYQESNKFQEHDII